MAVTTCPQTADGKHTWQVIGRCSHAIEQNTQPSYSGECLECSACGRVAHRWVRPVFACFRRRLTDQERAAAIAREHAACPIYERLQAQATQAQPTPAQQTPAAAPAAES